MSLKPACALLCCLCLLAAALLPAEGPGDPQLSEGIRLVANGEYDIAVIRLDDVVQRLKGEPSRSKEVAQAFLYLGIAYVGLGHDTLAKARLRSAFEHDTTLTLSARDFPPKVLELFEAAKEESRAAGRPPTSTPRPAAISTPAPRPTPAPTPVAAAPAPPPKKGGSKLPLVLLGLGGGAAAAVAAAGGGGGGGGSEPSASASPSTSTTASATITLVSASPPSGSTLSISRRDVLTLTFAVTPTKDVMGNVPVGIPFSTLTANPCVTGVSQDISFVGNQTRTVTVTVEMLLWGCALPSTTTTVGAYFGDFLRSGSPFIPAVESRFALTYEVVR